MLSFIPNDVMPKLILLVLGALVLAIIAVTVVKNENNVLPLKLTSDSKVVFASTYSRNNNRFVLAWQRAKQAGIIPEGADYKILQHYNWTGLNDKVNSAINSDGTNFAGTNKDVLDWGTVLVHASEISSAGGIDGYLVACPQLFTQYCKDNGKQTVVISLNHPYDVQAFPNADGILAVYGTTSLGLDITESFGGGTVGATAAFSPNLTAGTEVVLGTFGATGKLPVDVPKYVPGSKVYSTDENVYELGYGIEYDSIVEDADKTALNEMIEKAKSLNEDEFTAESWNDAASVLSELKDLLKTAENVNLTHKLAQSVVDGAKTDLQGKYAEVLALLVPNNTNKTALEIAIEMAESASLENVVPAVVEEFNAALENAQTVYANDNATQEEVDNAFTRLANAMHMLEFFKGNKELLQKQVDLINDLESNKYIESTWNAMTPVLEKAEGVLGNENAMQEEVDEVYSELVRAFINLRLKPNKDLLSGLINQANGLNRENYSAASLKAVDDVMTKASEVLNNPEATKEEVEAAVAALTKAMSGLEIKPNNPSVDTNTPVKPGDTTVSVKTGDTTNLLYPVAGMLLASFVLTVNKKRKNFY